MFYSNTKPSSRWWYYVGAGLLAILILVLIVLTANQLTQDEQARQLVNNFGYLGVVVISFIAGLNAIVPVPAGSFVPIFTAAGLELPLIIIGLIIGTTLADLLAWYIGVLGRKLTIDNYPRLATFVRRVRGQHIWFVIGFVFIYASVAPLPNEVILVPLALTGIRLRVLIIPLLLGTIIYNTILALTAQSLFDWLFV